ncbi:MAG TPA: PilZ domain-containing protein [Termitinemataceae bacterium]|mgnify:CR=1 FL=1|nr:PilZ domain-containing protein [Termitinemataceae bacterium]HOM23576.1 PilZ domain-containing protein [Termitinemataceae bacterium]HPP99843.1 PilZ domain-containing protein [Termitinemataceae bacterium]
MLLQSVYFRESDPRSAIIFLAVVGVLIIILVIYNIWKNGISIGTGKGGGTLAPRRFSRWALHRAAAAYGLDREEEALLEWIFRRASITDPVTTLGNTTILDRLFKKAYRDIEKTAETEDMANYQKALLFAIRNRVEAARGERLVISSTRKLSDNMAATIVSPRGESYPVRIITARGDYLLVENPRSAVGTPIKFPRGSKVTLSFYARSSQGYRFESRVIDTVDTPRGKGLQLAHSDHVEALPNRRYKRKDVYISCFFSLVRVEERKVGRKIEKKTIVDDRRSLGTIINVSAGGCAIKSVAALPAGAYLKIEFEDPQAKTLAALGRIVRTNKTMSMGGVMHIQFVKIPRKTLNTINAMVFEYDQD